MKEKTIVSFCTGGIRCEKGGEYLIQQGFKDVYQLHGGILQYFEDCGGAHFHGECFVFDQRIAVGNGLIVGDHEQCYACRHPVSPQDRESSKFRLGVSCPYCFDNLPEKTRARAIERQKQNVLSKKRTEQTPCSDH